MTGLFLLKPFPLTIIQAAGSAANKAVKNMLMTNISHVIISKYDK